MKTVRLLSGIIFVITLFALVLNGCSGDDDDNNDTSNGDFQMTSPAFSNNGTIPQTNTCDGADLSPQLEWSGAPPNVQSFTLLMFDTDAPGGAFHHWAIYDIPAGLEQLAGGIPPDAEYMSFMQGINDFGAFGYKGPCPPPGDGAHHYHFQLLALDVPSLNLAAGDFYNSVEAATSGHVLATALLVGLYSR